MSYQDAPIIADIQMTYAPEVQLEHEEIKEKKELLSGKPCYYHKGFMVRIKLRYEKDKPLLSSERESLKTVFSTFAPFIVTPYPQSRPLESFEVRWVGDFDFRPIEGLGLTLWTGEIKLEGTTVLESI